MSSLHHARLLSGASAPSSGATRTPATGTTGDAPTAAETPAPARRRPTPRPRVAIDDRDVIPAADSNDGPGHERQTPESIPGDLAVVAGAGRPRRCLRRPQG